MRGLYEQQQVYGMRRPAGAPPHPLLPKTLRRLEDYAAEMIAAWTR